MKGLFDSLDSFGRTTGDYWSRDNATFEKGDPSLGSRLVRAINPMTSFGSALGSMHDAAGQGLKPADTAIALLQAMPAYGSVLAKLGVAQGVSKTIPVQLINNYQKTLGKLVAGAGVSSVVDEAQAKGK